MIPDSDGIWTADDEDEDEIEDDSACPNLIVKGLADAASYSHDRAASLDLVRDRPIYRDDGERPTTACPAPVCDTVRG